MENLENKNEIIGSIILRGHVENSPFYEFIQVEFVDKKTGLYDVRVKQTNRVPGRLPCYAALGIHLRPESAITTLILYEQDLLNNGWDIWDTSLPRRMRELMKEVGVRRFIPQTPITFRSLKSQETANPT